MSKDDIPDDFRGEDPTAGWWISLKEAKKRSFEGVEWWKTSNIVNPIQYCETGPKDRPSMLKDFSFHNTVTASNESVCY